MCLIPLLHHSHMANGEVTQSGAVSLLHLVRGFELAPGARQDVVLIQYKYSICMHAFLCAFGAMLHCGQPPGSVPNMFIFISHISQWR